MSGSDDRRPVRVKGIKGHPAPTSPRLVPSPGSMVRLEKLRDMLDLPNLAAVISRSLLLLEAVVYARHRGARVVMIETSGAETDLTDRF